MLSYVINNTSTAVRPDKKTIKTDVKIHVVWDNNGGTQDYYGYQTYTGQYALIDGIERAGGVDEVWITEGKNAMTISQIATGNYGSVSGTWKNLKGDLLIFTNGNCTVSAWNWSGNLIVGGVVPEGIVDNIAWASGNPAPRPDGIAFMFAPAGISPNNIGGPDLTDASKE